MPLQEQLQEQLVQHKLPLDPLLEPALHVIPEAERSWVEVEKAVRVELQLPLPVPDAMHSQAALPVSPNQPVVDLPSSAAH